MDLLTQAALGATLACAVARPEERRLAALVGAIGGALPDADVLVRSARDPLLAVEFHRTATHALLAMPLIGLLAAGVCWLATRRRHALTRLWWFGTLGCATHAPLDICTSFGVQLLWPVWDTRLALRCVAVLDPLFTGVLLVGLALALRRRTRRPALIALGLCGLYLLVGLSARHAAEGRLRRLAEERGHPVSRLEAKPTLGNLLLWRGVYQTGERIHAAAIRLSPFGTRVTSGDSATHVRPEMLYPQIAPQTALARDLRRFDRLAASWMVRHPEAAGVVGDARYSMLPHRIVPLWGVAPDPAHPERHVRFVTFRKADRATMRSFWSLLCGAGSTTGR